MKSSIPVLAVMLSLALGACRGGATGTSTTWHLQEHSVTVNGTETGFIADCWGNNRLNWEVLDTGTFKQPVTVGVYCGMYSTPPSANKFHGWGETRTNWPDTSACDLDTRDPYGKKSCKDYFRAVRDHVAVSAPWCGVSFKYSEPVTTQFTVITYCVTQ